MLKIKVVYIAYVFLGLCDNDAAGTGVLPVYYSMLKQSRTLAISSSSQYNTTTSSIKHTLYY